MRNWTLFACIAAVAILSLVAAAQNPIRTGAAAFGDWRADAPGIQRHIRPADLPPAKLGTDTENADLRASPRVVERPGSATPKVPAGFSADLYASGLNQPRVIRRAPNGDIFVAESGAGRVRILRAPDGATRVAQQAMFAENLQRPYGIAFYPPGDNPRFIYVGETHQVVRFPYTNGDLRASGPAQVIVPSIPTSRHWTRDVAVAADGGQLFVAVGSGSNVAGDMPSRSPEEIRSFEATHGRGAAWGPEENRAVVRA